MGEPARQERFVIGGDNSKPGADAKTGRPNLEVFQGGNTAARGERVPLEVVADEDAETVTTDEAETAPTEKNIQSGDVQEDSAVEIEPVRELEDFSETAPALTFNVAKQVKRANEIVLSAEEINDWLDYAKQPNKEEAGETEGFDQFTTKWLVKEDFIPDYEEQAFVEKEVVVEQQAVEHVVEGAKALLKRQWGEVGSRLKKLFGHEDARRWAGSTVFGVVAAFAIAGLTSAMVGDYQKNVKIVVERSLQNNEVAQVE